MKRKILIGLTALTGLLLGAAVFALSLATVSPEAIQASVHRAPELIERAWQLPVAASFKPALTWQSNGSLCGPASVANAFRSLGEPATTEAAVLAGTGRCRFGICVLGLTLDQLAEVAQANTTRKVTVLRDLTAEAFREHLRRANDPSRRYIINFARERIFGTGVGHHSPIGGYLETEDLVFVLDVNRDFQPWLVERSRLFSAMDTFDGDKKRGLLLIE
jgi:Phytochelatin synthase